MTQGRRKGVLPYGNGCNIHPNCFTCPAPDCVSRYGANKETQKMLSDIWEPYFKRELSKVALGGKG